MLLIPPPFIIKAAPVEAGVSAEYIAGNFSYPLTTAPSFPNAEIGNEADQLVAVVFAWAVNGTSTMVSASIGGVPATIAVQGSGSNGGVALFYAKAGSDAPVTISAAFSTEVYESTFMVYRVTGQTSDAPADQAVNAGGGAASRSVTLDVPAGGALVAGAYNAGVNPPATVWTNADQDAEFVYSITWRASCASRETPDALESLTVTNSVCRQIVAASWV